MEKKNLDFMLPLPPQELDDMGYVERTRVREKPSRKKKLWWIPQQILDEKAEHSQSYESRIRPQLEAFDGKVFHTRFGKELYEAEMKEKLIENKEIDEDKTDANTNVVGGIKMSDNAEKK